MKAKQKPAKRAAAAKPEGRLSPEEVAAMKEHVQELKAAARRGSRPDPAEVEREVLATIAAMPQPDRALGERIHALVKAHAPALTPRLWYGMPAYARDGNVVCFFQGAHKFKARYATLGFSDKAKLDDGAIWPVAFAVAKLSAADEARIAALLKTAVR